jgi:hypothetical protein
MPDLTTAQAAALLKMDRQNLLRLLRAGRFPGAHQVEVEGQPNPVWRVPSAAVEGFTKMKPGKKPQKRKGKHATRNAT